MRDVALHAGVSFKTVSRVANGEGGVSDDLVGRVEAAIALLSYKPDDRARHLRQTAHHTGAIGFVMVDVANPFFSSILRGIEEVARQRGYLVLAGSTDGAQEREDQLVEAFIARRVDGLVVVPSGSVVGTLRTELERGSPVVFLDVEPDDLAVDLVRSDHRGGAAAATGHLIDHGHRDIGYFGDDPAIYSAGLRLAGFHDAMTASGLDVPLERLVTGTNSAEAWREIVLESLTGTDLPTAIFTSQNFITVGAAHALHDQGLRNKIAHIGFDDIELADIVHPGISVVPQHPRNLGRRAAEILFGRIDGEVHAPIRDVIECHIVARESGELPPFR